MVPAADQVTRIYQTRFRERLALHKRYDAIFATVVKKVMSEVSLPPPPPQSSIFVDEIRKRSASETLPERSRVRFDSEPEVLPPLCIPQEPPPTRNPNGRRKPNRKTKVKRLYTPKRKKKKAVSASVIPVIRPETACYCGVVVCSHARLHEHILYEHSYPTIIRCSQCGASAERVHEHHICSICDVFADNLEEHLKNHYRDRLGSGAFMECRLCCKTFLTVKEVVIHERVSHARVRKLSSYECEYCGDCFATKHVRDNHLLRHFEESIGDIWDRVEQMQSELTGVVVINQCPICSSVLATRRSFRVHVVQKHLLKDPEVFLEIISTPPLTLRNTAVKQEPQLPADTCDVIPSSVVVKKEIKQECLD